VKISNCENSLEIVETGLRLFLNQYINVKYSEGLQAKLGIYCGTINKLEEQIYPLVESVVSEYGLKPTEVILKFHRGNKQYNVPLDSQLEFDTLDKKISKIRIVLLVQIGKEGWDCKSLSGIILSHEGDCPKNMVLQPACRCLRQVEKNSIEPALIYLNESNAEKLNSQLKQQHHISIKELEDANSDTFIQIKRYDRTNYLRLPKVDFYQLKVNYKTLIIDDKLNVGNDIINAIGSKTKVDIIVKTQDFSGKVFDIEAGFFEQGSVIVNINIWLYTIAKESFGFVTPQMLEKYRNLLDDIFEKITYSKDGLKYFSSRYNVSIINENIRKAFYEKRTFESTEELIPTEASLLNITNFTDSVYTSNAKEYYPDTQTVENILQADSGKNKSNKKIDQLLEIAEKAEEAGDIKIAEQIRNQYSAHPMKDKSFHYIPYKTDSSFEQIFLKEVLLLSGIKEENLEVYYNGDRTLTEFKIKCFKKVVSKWQYVGMYTPDFIIINRIGNKIHKAIIVETKGEIYASDPKFLDKKTFMEVNFISQNNTKYGYKRFEYLYLEDSLSESERIVKTANAINEFFKEVK
jgi:hypothetical protein